MFCCIARGSCNAIAWVLIAKGSCNGLVLLCCEGVSQWLLSKIIVPVTCLNVGAKQKLLFGVLKQQACDPSSISCEGTSETLLASEEDIFEQQAFASDTSASLGKIRRGLTQDLDQQGPDDGTSSTSFSRTRRALRPPQEGDEQVGWETSTGSARGEDVHLRQAPLR